MATLPIADQTPGVYTMGEMVRRVLDDINEPATDKLRKRAIANINDGIESIWMSLLLATLSKMSRGPVQQIFPASETQVQLISVPDPTIPPSVAIAAGGALGVRTLYAGFVLVTDSGSTTKLSPLVQLDLIDGQLLQINPPPYKSDTVGWYPFVSSQANGSDAGQQGPLQLFNQSWVEPPAGYSTAPEAPPAPAQNTTGDNIFAIDRIDVQNVDMTWTAWIQTNHSSSWFTEFQHKVSTTTTWMPFVYDFLDEQWLQFRPAPAADLTGQFFYTVRPRRLAFPQSRLPYTQFAYQAFLHDYALARCLQSIYEFEASDRWKKDAEVERQRILLQVGAGNWNQNLTVRPFMR